MLLKTAYLGVALSVLLALRVPAFAQSHDRKNPTPLQPGINSGTCNTIGTPQYWYFYAEPGSFTGAVIRRNLPGQSIKPSIGVGVAFAPKLQNSVVASVDKGDLTNFSGSVKSRDKVIIMIDPGHSGLPSMACKYDIQVSGAVSFASLSSAASAPAIAGVYMSEINDYGMTRFKPDGGVVAASGVTGRWTLSDQQHNTYAVDMAGAHMALKLVPGRGLVEADNPEIVTFKQMK